MARSTGTALLGAALLILAGTTSAGARPGAGPGAAARSAPQLRPDGFAGISGDFDGDGRADVVSFGRGPRARVRVALSTGSSFADPVRVWHHHFAAGSEVPLVGDVNGDGRTDIVAADRRTGQVHVALSTGTEFRTTGPAWHHRFATGTDAPATGDFNGDGRTDLANINRRTGQIHVALSTGTEFRATAFRTTGPASHLRFATATDTPATGDFNGDGRTDLANINRRTGQIHVALSTGTGFRAAGAAWHPRFPTGARVPGVGDFDGDGRHDIVAFSRGGSGDVWVGRSTGSGFAGPGRKWHSRFAFGGDIPHGAVFW